MDAVCEGWLEDRDTGVDVDEAWLTRAARETREACARHGVGALLGLGENPRDAAAFQAAKDRLDEACAWARQAATEELARVRCMAGGAPLYAAYQEWRLAVQGVAWAVDILEQLFEWRAGTDPRYPWRQHHRASRALSWIEYRGKEGREEPVATKVSWGLLLQIRAEVRARADGVFLCDRALYRRVPFSPYGGEPLRRPGKDEGMELPEWLWRGVLRLGEHDAELTTAVRREPGLVEGAAKVLASLHGMGLPRAEPTRDYVAFRNGCLALVTDGRPGLRWLPNGHEELAGILTCTAHDVDFDPALLALPLPPCLRAEDRLAWMQGPLAEVDPMPLDYAGPDHLGARARVQYHILSQHPYSAQTLWLSLVGIGRTAYENCRFDAWEAWWHWYGESRGGKNKGVMDRIRQHVGPAHYGLMKVGRADTFGMSGAAEWHVLACNEFQTDQEGLPGLANSDILGIVSGESWVERRMREHPRTVERCRFQLVTAANPPVRLKETAGEMSARCIQIPMLRSFAGREDMTLGARAKREVAANLVLGLRAYVETLAALGDRSIHAVRPADLQAAAERARIANDYLAVFLNDADWCTLAPPADVEAALAADDGRPVRLPLSSLDELGHGFAEWLRDKGARRSPWVPRRYEPVLAAHGLAWGDLHSVERYPLNERVHSQGLVYGVALTGLAQDRLRRREADEPDRKRARD